MKDPNVEVYEKEQCRMQIAINQSLLSLERSVSELGATEEDDEDEKEYDYEEQDGDVGGEGKEEGENERENGYNKKMAERSFSSLTTVQQKRTLLNNKRRDMTYK